VAAASDVPVHQWLFSDSPSRVVVSVAAERATDLERACGDSDLACVRLGTATEQRRLTCGDVLDLDLDDIAARQARVLPDLFEAH